MAKKWTAWKNIIWCHQKEKPVLRKQKKNLKCSSFHNSHFIHPVNYSNLLSHFMKKPFFYSSLLFCIPLQSTVSTAIKDLYCWLYALFHPIKWPPCLREVHQLTKQLMCVDNWKIRRKKYKKVAVFYRKKYTILCIQFTAEQKSSRFFQTDAVFLRALSCLFSL